MLSRSITMILVAAVLAAVLASAGPAASMPWSDVAPQAIAPAGDRVITPDRYRTLTLDRPEMAAFLVGVPLRGTPAATASRAVIELPLPDGGVERFSIVEAPIMAPALQARYPQIRTYAGSGIDDPTATVRLDYTPSGFHGLILSPRGTIYIDPFQRGDVVHYQCYYRRDYVSSANLEGCTIVDEDGMADEIAALVAGGAGIASGSQ